MILRTFSLFWCEKQIDHIGHYDGVVVFSFVIEASIGDEVFEEVPEFEELLDFVKLGKDAIDVEIGEAGKHVLLDIAALGAAVVAQDELPEEFEVYARAGAFKVIEVDCDASGAAGTLYDVGKVVQDPLGVLFIVWGYDFADVVDYGFYYFVYWDGVNEWVFSGNIGAPEVVYVRSSAFRVCYKALVGFDVLITEPACDEELFLHLALLVLFKVIFVLV
jgi:hypothetical protein